MKHKHAFLSLHVLVPLLIGGLIYICWRGPDLLMFGWFKAIGLEPLVIKLETAGTGVAPLLPSWIIFSLPDGLWVYALTAFFVRVWSGIKASRIRTLFLSLSLVLGAGSELGQLAHLVPGTFDWIDFAFYLSAAVLAFYFASGKHPERSSNEWTSRTNPGLARRFGSFSGAGLWQRVFDE